MAAIEARSTSLLKSASRIARASLRRSSCRASSWVRSSIASPSSHSCSASSIALSCSYPNRTLNHSVRVVTHLSWMRSSSSSALRHSCSSVAIFRWWFLRIESRHRSCIRSSLFSPSFHSRSAWAMASSCGSRYCTLNHSTRSLIHFSCAWRSFSITASCVWRAVCSASSSSHPSRTRVSFIFSICISCSCVPYTQRLPPGTLSSAIQYPPLVFSSRSQLATPAAASSSQPSRTN